MAFKIKEGSEIAPYGAGGAVFTSETVLSQPILEHLATRFPDDVIDDSATKKAAAKDVVALIAAATTVDQVNEIVGDDDRKSVTDAAAKKIAELDTL